MVLLLLYLLTIPFVVPFVLWIKEEKYYNIVKETFNKDFVSEFFDVEKINTILEDHYNNKRNNGSYNFS